MDPSVAGESTLTKRFMKVHPTVASVRKKIDSLFDGTVVGAQKASLISEGLAYVDSKSSMGIMKQLSQELKAEFSMNIGDALEEDFMVLGDEPVQ